MKKFIPSIIVLALVALVALAGQLTYTTTQVDTVIGAGLATNGTHSVATVMFTNGASIVCSGTNLVFLTP